MCFNHRAQLAAMAQAGAPRAGGGSVLGVEPILIEETSLYSNFNKNKL